LFRKGLPPPPPPSSNNDDEKVVLCKKGVDVKYHPIFDAICSLTEFNLKDVEVHYLSLIADASNVSGNRVDRDRESGEANSGDPRKYADVVVKVQSLKCVNEIATSPPCRRLCWAFCGVPEATNDTGVTVKDAIEALVAMWGSSVDGYSKDSGEEDVCWLDTLEDHRFWEGISSSDCDVDDEVSFGAQFGS